MAARDILTLENSMAPRLIRILYGLALLLIAVMVILGVVRGIEAATRMPAMPPLPMTGQATPAPAGVAPMPADGRGTMGMRGERRMGRGMMMGRRMGERNQMMGRRGLGFMGVGPRRNPILFGALMILRTLVMGFVTLLVVRILAELAQTVLAMPTRTEPR